MLEGKSELGWWWVYALFFIGKKVTLAKQPFIIFTNQKV
jgi:hypothetical protein